jgi:hypothetical protein
LFVVAAATSFVVLIPLGSVFDTDDILRHCDNLWWICVAHPAGASTIAISQRYIWRPQRLLSSLPFGLPSSPPFPNPLLPLPLRPIEAATTFGVSEVDSSMVIAGGVTAANLPHVLRNWRRSSSWSKFWGHGKPAIC